MKACILWLLQILPAVALQMNSTAVHRSSADFERSALLGRSGVRGSESNIIFLFALLSVFLIAMLFIPFSSWGYEKEKKYFLEEVAGKGQPMTKEPSEEDKQSLFEMRISVFDTYSVVSALIMSCAASMARDDSREYENFDANNEELVVSLKVFVIGIQRLFITNVASMELYSSLVFVLCALYTRSALAKPQYGLALCEHLFDSTGPARRRAFLSMFLAAMFFFAQLILGCFAWPQALADIDVPHVLHDYCAIGGGLFVVAVFSLGVYDTHEMMKKASVVFFPDSELEEAFSKNASSSSKA